MKKPKETPPFAYEMRDPHWDVTYYVFSYSELKTTTEIWSHVARFLGARKRRMPKNHQNLPKVVNLTVTQDGKVRAFDLPTQRQLEQAQKAENQQKKRIQKFLDSPKKKK